MVLLLIGLGAGALLGLMYAPRSGDQFRRDMRKRYRGIRSAVEDFADEARDRVEEVLERGADLWEEMDRDPRIRPIKRALQRN